MGKNSIIYLLVNLFQVFTTFFLTSVYSRYLSKDDFGTLCTINSFISLLTFVYTFCLHSAIGRFYFDYKNNLEGFYKYVRSILLVLFIFDIILSLVFLLLREYFFSHFLKGIEFYPYILITLVIGIFNVGLIVWQTLLQSQQLGGKYALLQFFYQSVTLGIICFLLFFLEITLLNVLLCLAAVNFMIFSGLLFSVGKGRNPFVSWENIRKSINYSFPIFLHGLAGWTTVYANKIFINNNLGASQVGVYEFGFLVSGAMNLLSGSINQAFIPWLFSNMSNENYKLRLVKITEMFVYLYGIAFIFLAYFSREMISLLFPQADEQSWKVVPVLTLGFVFNGIYFFFVSTLFYHKKHTKYVLIATVTGGLLNIVLNALITKTYGIFGSAIASSVSLLVVSFLTYFIAERLSYVGFHLSRIYLPVLFFLILSIVAYFDFLAPSTFFIVKLLVFATLFLAIGFFYYDEIKVAVRELIVRR